MRKNETNPVIIANGECGECTWTIDADGLLLIAPTDGVRGMLEDITKDTVPWKDHKDVIRAASITLGVFANKSVSHMFHGCENMVAADLHHLDTSNVTNMSDMFDRCNTLKTLDISGFNTSKVINMSGMFTACFALTSLDVSNFDTSNVTDMGFMFCSCGTLTSLDVSSFDTSNVTDMNWMFCGCSSLVLLDLTHFNTSQVECMSWIFLGCDSPTLIRVSRHFGWKSGEDVSADCSARIERCDPVYLNGSLETCGECIWAIDADGLLLIAPESGVRGTLDDITENTVPWVDYRNEITSAQFFPGVIAGAHMDYIFSGCKNMKSVVFDDLDMSEVRTMKGMFRDCASLHTVSLNPSEKCTVKKLDDIFTGCASLTSVDLSGCALLKNIESGIFNGLPMLSSVILPKSVARIDRCAFSKCKNLTHVTIPNDMEAHMTEYSSEGDRNWEVPNPDFNGEIDRSAFKDSPVTLIISRWSWVEDYAKENGIPYEYLTDRK